MSALPSGFTLLQVLPALEAGGVEQTTLDISRAVVASGGRSLVASEGGRLVGALEREGARHLVLPLDRKTPLGWAEARLRLQRLIRAEGVDLVHVRSRWPAFSAIPAARAVGAPVVTTYHGVYNARGPIKRRYNRIMTRADLVIANSEYTRRHVLAEHAVAPDRVVAIPRGVDLERFDPVRVEAWRIKALRESMGLDPTDPSPLVLLAGRLTRWKGQALLIEALAAARARGVRARLVLAGDPQGRDAYVRELEAQVMRLGLGAEVRIPGHVEDMPALYALCDVAAAPSLEPEAFGRTAVEPQAMGKPVMAADHGATAETVVDGETGLRLAPGEVGAWADGLVRMAALGPEGRAAMGARGQARTRRLYGVDAMQARTLAAYVHVLGGAPARPGAEGGRA